MLLAITMAQHVSAATTDRVELCEERILRYVYLLNYRREDAFLKQNIKDICLKRYEPGPYEPLTDIAEGARQLWEGYSAKIIVTKSFLRNRYISYINDQILSLEEEQILNSKINLWLEDGKKERDRLLGSHKVPDTGFRAADMAINYINEDFDDFVKFTQTYKVTEKPEPPVSVVLPQAVTQPPVLNEPTSVPLQMPSGNSEIDKNLKKLETLYEKYEKKCPTKKKKKPSKKKKKPFCKSLKKSIQKLESLIDS